MRYLMNHFVAAAALVAVSGCSPDVTDLAQLDAVEVGDNDGKSDSPAKATPFTFPDGIAMLSFAPDVAGYFSSTLTLADSEPVVVQLSWSQSDNLDADPTPMPMYVRVTSPGGVKKSELLSTPVVTGDGDDYTYTYSLNVTGYPGKFKVLISTRDNMLEAARTPAGAPVSTGNFLFVLSENTPASESDLSLVFPKPPVRQCTGSPPPCSAAVNRADCGTRLLGCYWNVYTNICIGAPTPCATLTGDACSKQENCTL